MSSGQEEYRTVRASMRRVFSASARCESDIHPIDEIARAIVMGMATLDWVDFSVIQDNHIPGDIFRGKAAHVALSRKGAAWIDQSGKSWLQEVWYRGGVADVGSTDGTMVVECGGTSALKVAIALCFPGMTVAVASHRVDKVAVFSSETGIRPTNARGEGLFWARYDDAVGRASNQERRGNELPFVMGGHVVALLGGDLSTNVHPHNQAAGLHSSQEVPEMLVSRLLRSGDAKVLDQVAKEAWDGDSQSLLWELVRSGLRRHARQNGTSYMSLLKSANRAQKG